MLTAPASDDLFAAALKHFEAGELDRAAELYEAVLRAEPDCAEALHHSALIALQRAPGQAGVTQALERLERAALLAPQAPPPQAKVIWNDLGAVRRHAGLPVAQAQAAFAHAVAIDPGYAEAWHNLGLCRRALADRTGAVEALARAAELAPDFAPTHMARGVALTEIDDLPGAIAAFSRALELEPDSAEAMSNLGYARHQHARAPEGEALMRRALELKPDLLEARLNLANILADTGDIEEARQRFIGVLELDPGHFLALGSALLLSHYDPAESGASLLGLARDWARLAEARAPAATPPFANPALPGRRLRIGYVSPDLRDHACAYFLEPLLAHHDAREVEVFAYAELRKPPDAVTSRLRALVDHWCETRALSDSELALRMRADGIDIAVDLAGHTKLNRLPAFAHRPAPVIVSWLGYPGTTGMGAIGWRITDAIADPPGLPDAQYSESLVRLARPFLCYRPPQGAPEVAKPPQGRAGRVAFGCFNNPAKISGPVAQAWTRLLDAVPGSILVLKAFWNEARHAGPRARALFEAAGLAPERLAMRPWSGAVASHLAAYGEIDVALDPFPYNGATTTCEALWMGVPVVTLAGQRHSGRVGASLLAGAGLDELIARDVDDYVAIAAGLATDPPRLASLRAGLRPLVAASSLCDEPGFARAVEGAYRDLWRKWCETG